MKVIMSKRNLYITALASMAALFGACSQEQETADLTSRAITFASGAGNFNSRLSQDGNQWSAGDEIGIYMLQAGTEAVAGYSNVPYRADAAAQTTAFLPVAEAISYPEMGDAVDFMAYYPYSGAIEGGIYPIQLANQSASLVAHDLMYAKANNGGSGYTSGSVALNFTHQLAKLRLLFVDEENNPLTLDANGIAIQGMSTTAQFSLATATLAQQADVFPITPYFTGSSYEAILLPYVIGAGHEVTLSVAGNPYRWVMNSTHPALEITAGKAYTFKVTVKTSEAEVEVVLVDFDGSTIDPWGDGGADNQEKEVIEDIDIPADFEQIVVASGASIKDALASATTAKVAILLESAGSYQEASSFAIPASIKSLMLVGKSGTVPASVYLGGSLSFAGDVDLFHLYHVELHGVRGSGYLFNQSTKINLKESIIEQAVLHDLRGLFRMRSGTTMGSYKIVNSIVYAIDNYNLLSMENESTIEEVELSKSTFFDFAGRAIHLNSVAAATHVVVDQCTFNQGPLYAIVQFNGTHKGTLTFTKNIIGLPFNDTRGVSVASNAESMSELGNYYVSNTVWQGTAVGEDCGYAASALFGDYTKGDFTQSKVQAGDPRWYK